MKVKVRPIRSTTEEDSDEDENHVTLSQLLRPSLICLAISGCYTYDPYTIKTGKQTTEGRVYRILGTVYRLIFLCVGIVACAKGIASVATATESLFIMTIALLAHYIQNIVIFLIAMRCDYSKNGWHRKAFDFWDDKIGPEMEALGIKFPLDKIRKCQKLYLSISLSAWISSSALIGALSFTQFKTIFSLPFAGSVLIVAATFCAMIMINLIWIFPLEYIVMMCTVMKIGFETINACLVDNLSQNLVSKTFQFQRLRQLHLNHSRIVTFLDKDFGIYFAFIFLFTIGFVCVQLYIILKMKLDNLVFITAIFFCLSAMSILCVVAVFAAWVHEAAHSPLEAIYGVGVEGITTVQLGQLNLFLSKLTGTQIGFTTLGLLTITKEFILTLAGAFVTYFFLLYTTV